ncbi:acetolactate synthase-1/2/3 large subunit [Chitinivorax tropicus]|uniref:Acetolactate synthase-1/2/3 large subunit n=1 Tax=Chitinivorax tropicus TaxID=714531 RepID=A0A840MQ92_9PROT|nr:thiamine pyrophosphate-binding protein [Chitinivorax tropicus]MBB5018343.1 acetolactate synthase-1/2/3 large subunit [Chitinivorax tropicus]
MTAVPPIRNGAQALVDALLVHGADTGFCVPGESYLPVLDALYDVRDRFNLVVCRQEGGAAYMADAYGKLHGKPGICFVTRGPGATNASVGLHTAFQDSSPMILFIGQVGRDAIEREAFQELDYRRMFGQLAKWVAQIDDARRIPEFISRAFHTATSGRPGPVVLALPEDMLHDLCDTAQPQTYRRIAAAPSPAAMVELQSRLSQAQRPVLIVGGRGWTAAACRDLQTFSERWQLPVACAFRYQDLFDHTHPHYIGDVGLGINPKLRARLQEADLVLTIGARLGESTTNGYALFDIPRPAQTLIHVHAGAEELGRVYAADLPINSGYPEFLSAALAMAVPTQLPWAEGVAGSRQVYLDWSTPGSVPGQVQMGEIMCWLRERLPADAIVTNGAGNYAIWLHRFYRYRQFGTQLAPTNGSMGYGVPAAIAAKITQPERIVVAFAGDGCYMMNGQELATAVKYGANVVFIVVNNGMYGTIRMHQEREYPERVMATSLVNPDFAALAVAYGAHGERVTDTAQFASAFERALAAGKPALIELQVDPEAITPATTITQLRAQR